MAEAPERPLDAFRVLRVYHPSYWSRYVSELNTPTKDTDFSWFLCGSPFHKNGIRYLNICSKISFYEESTGYSYKMIKDSGPVGIVDGPEDIDKLQDSAVGVAYITSNNAKAIRAQSSEARPQGLSPVRKDLVFVLSSSALKRLDCRGCEIARCARRSLGADVSGICKDGGEAIRGLYSGDLQTRRIILNAYLDTGRHLTDLPRH